MRLKRRISVNKYIGILVVALMSTFVFNPPCLPEAATNESESTITFKGTEDTNESDLIPDGVEDDLSGDHVAKEEGDKLPHTATNMFSFIAIGLVLLAAGLLFILFRLKNTCRVR